ncbi:MAG: hypothetical protein OXG24_05530, partial [Gammaproteobacteria bacterium]|nr:hypothetical protein [Gammaproteobacteria bacterium]
MFFQVNSTAHFLKEFEQACQWLQLTKGRTRDYENLLREFDASEPPSEEHLMAYFESFDLVELWHLWHPHSDQFPGLREKLQHIFKKGHVLSDDERKTQKSDQSRSES